jgi:hypothetical protein
MLSSVRAAACLRKEFVRAGITQSALRSQRRKIKRSMLSSVRVSTAATRCLRRECVRAGITQSALRSQRRKIKRSMLSSVRVSTAAARCLRRVRACGDNAERAEVAEAQDQTRRALARGLERGSEILRLRALCALCVIWGMRHEPRRAFAPGPRAWVGNLAPPSALRALRYLGRRACREREQRAANGCTYAGHEPSVRGVPAASASNAPRTDARMPVTRRVVSPSRARARYGLSLRLVMWISTRRLVSRPSGVPLSAIGFSSPKPCEVMRPEATPLDSRYARTDAARFFESFML